MILRIPDKCPSVYEDHDRQITLPTNKCCSKILQALSTGTNRNYSSKMVVICQIIDIFNEGDINSSNLKHNPLGQTLKIKLK
jgi:hypothetical protein